MHKLSFVNYYPQCKQPEAMRKSRISAIKMAASAYLRFFITKSQSKNRFYVHNADPKTDFGHKLSNESLRLHAKQLLYILVLISLITKTTRQKIKLQLSNMIFLQRACSFRPCHAVSAN
jgi:hypothetical protein